MRNFFIFSTLFLCLVPCASTKIVWMSKWEICVMDDDGKKVQRLTYNNIYDGSPRWTPNGKHIAFEREQERETNEQNHDLFLMNIDGTQVRKLTTYTGLDINPDWSADSEHISFTSTRSGEWNVHIMNVETHEVRELTPNMEGHSAGRATWSTDGKKIAYVSTRRNPYQETIYIVDADGTNQRRFTRPVAARHYSLRWSPDRKQILYCETKRKNNQVISNKIIIRTETGHLVQEIEMPPRETWFINAACWMGMQHLLIDAIEDDGRGQSDILRYTIATGQIINLTNSPIGNDGFPDWIDDAALAITPAHKLAVLWGLLKQID
ncbi:hypothetical protein C6501_09970 [Candidatus Poribacteria bacterium]|nr:MAG: hypothetical protein C6501_09970 [Candidatus Poribacteria bacterium]